MPALPFEIRRSVRRIARVALMSGMIPGLTLLFALAATGAWAAEAPMAKPAAGHAPKSASKPASKPTARRAAAPGPLAPALAAEFALQAGKLDDAAKGYLQAAKVARDDAVLAERATNVALLAKNDALANEALALWRARAGRTLAVRGAEATLSIRRKDAAAAQQQLRELLDDRTDDKALPGEGWRHALLAMDAGAGDPKFVGQLLAALVERIPDSMDAYLAFGEFAQQLQREDLSDRIIGQVLAKYADVPGASLLKADQLRRAGKDEEARAVLAKAAADQRLTPEIAEQIARQYAQMGDAASAAAVVARMPVDDHSVLLRVSYLAQADDKPGVARLYDEMKAQSSAPDPARRLLLGQIAEFIERYDEALDWYGSVPGGPSRWQAQLRMAPVLHKLGRKPAAYDKLDTLQSSDVAPEQTRRDAYLLEADLHLQDKAADLESAAYDRGLASFPDEPDLLYARALMWERRDDIPRAEADFRRILAADADNVAALNALGYTLADRTERFQEALELIARAIAAEPDNGAIIDSYGWVLYRLGRKEEALSELRRAFTKQKDAEIASHVGEVLWVLGKKTDAMNYFEQARKIEPDNRALQRALDRTGAVLPPMPAKAGA